MKKFLILIAKILVLTLMLLILLDFLYTSVYLQSSKRGKIDSVYNSKDINYDVVVLGSSRANNHFVTPMFEDRGIKAFNFGMSGSHLFEASLMLKMMMERNYKINTIILETDLNICNEKLAEGIACRFLPYIHDSEIIEQHFSKEENFEFIYYIPFYRYIHFDSRIGFREMFFNLIDKRTNHLDNLGYHSLDIHSKGNMKNNLVSLKPLKNKYYEEIMQICKANNIRLISVMTPMCSNVKGMEYFDKVKALYPEIHNYENVVQEDEFFSSCGHMNDRGARLFTERILNDFFGK